MTGRTRNRRGDGGRLRTDIIAAAIDLLDETGDEHAVTLRAVARRVGITAPSIYPHFTDRPTLMLAVVQTAFAELTDWLETAHRNAGDDPRRQLHALSAAYLDFAQARPQRYRTMFGGQFDPTPGLTGNTLTFEDVAALGMQALQLFTDALAGCVAARQSTSTDPGADAVALWLGLHGLAHQRAVTHAFPWPADIAERLITSLAHLGPIR
ncbi:TetR/AcrR family transcriptional regulator [Actinoplanes sp. CA-252034]|uniref:TetR/AcrR family transcriptional regulator n=1 Tax=Actinoplanes sp. CA-252034 TaxID=3239906 RepID=UPI003D97E7AF